MLSVVRCTIKKWAGINGNKSSGLFERKVIDRKLRKASIYINIVKNSSHVTLDWRETLFKKYFTHLIPAFQGPPKVDAYAGL